MVSRRSGSSRAAEGLTLRHDHGTPKQHLLWLRTFDTIEVLRQALIEFKDRYNRAWLIQRHGHRTPSQA